MFQKYSISPLLLLVFIQGLCQDSIRVAIAPEYNDVKGIHRLFFGNSYRRLWAAPVKMRVLHLALEKGGLRPAQRGGGLQTKSLRLKDSSGREWVLRSVQKYPERALPPKLKGTIIKDILQDQVVTSHPYAALTVPPFAETLGILTTHPEIVYVADDPLLGEYRSEFGNSVLLLEEREPEEAKGTDNTEKAIRAIEKDNDVRIDQRKLLRARLLDLFLGDWDRHEDQWRWLEQKGDTTDTYLPYPRDRDKVFYTTSGVLPVYLSYQYLKSNLQRFDGHVRYINTYNYNNRYFDRSFLNELNRWDWEKEADSVQSLLTDSLIESAIRRLPDTIFQLSGPKLIRILKERRTNLRNMALTYFESLSKFVDLPGTNKGELFEIKHLPDGFVTVRVLKLKKDRTVEQQLFQRQFDPAFTKEIRLFGLDGNDVFSIEGESKSPVRIYITGGKGQDSFHIDKKERNKKKLFIYDWAQESNRISDPSLASVKITDDSLLNTYNRQNFKFEKLRPLFLFYYNRDQGLSIRTGLVHERQAFHKEPYANKNLFVVHYSSGWRSLALSFQSEYKKLFWGNDLALNLTYRGPNNLVNFFGLGNESVFSGKRDERLNYFRSQYNLSYGDIRIRRKMGAYWKAHAGLSLQYYAVSPTKNVTRYLTVYNGEQPSEEVFSDRLFSGVVAGFGFDSRKEEVLPRKGFYWNTEISGIKQISKGIRTYGQVQSEVGVYVPLISGSSFVLANRIGGGFTSGEPLFFQRLYLGGLQNLRGYAINRFAGNHLFYHNAELRVKLFDFAAYLFPGTVGLTAFHDVGRVWMPGESSGTWHRGYGGGLYLVPADAFLLQAAVSRSVEGVQPYFSLGFVF